MADQKNCNTIDLRGAQVNGAQVNNMAAGGGMVYCT